MMNQGIDSFDIECTYKPYNPYIHISPNYKGLYGKDFDDIRGLICGGDFSEKMHLLMDFTDRPGEVADPWYTDDCEATWRDVEEGCRGLLHYLTNERGVLPHESKRQNPAF